MRRIFFLLTLAMLLACAAGPPPPAALDTKNELCRFCRMPVSDPHLAAQIVAKGEEARFFDDLGCLRDFLVRSPAPPGSVVYVADHRSGAWARAEEAVYTRASIETPMGSRVIAHANAESHDADPAARGGAPLTAKEFFERAELPAARRP